MLFISLKNINHSLISLPQYNIIFSPISNILQDILRLILTIELFDIKEMDGMKYLSNQIKPSTKKRLKFSRV